MPGTDGIGRGSRPVAIVTGGGRGIGQAAAKAVALDGVAVAVVARTKVERTAPQIRAGGGSATALPTDVSDPDSTSELTEDAEREPGGRVGILVNAAGITGPVGEFAEIDRRGGSTL